MEKNYGSHLWDMDIVLLVSLMNRAYRKGVRHGLGMRKRYSVVDGLGKWFCGSVRESEEIAVNVYEEVNSFCEWCSKLCGIAYRDKLGTGKINENLFAWSYRLGIDGLVGFWG